MSACPGDFAGSNECYASGVSVVVPVYNGSQTLESLCDRVDRVFAALGKDYEIIMVNDGSHDDSWSRIVQLGARPHVHGINLFRNYGQHNALLCGIRAARYEVIVTIDDDLQNPPEEIPALVEKLGGAIDVVYGAPEKRNHGFLRDLASEITKRALQASMGVDAARHVSAFRAFKTYLREAFKSYNSPMVSIDVLLTWGTSRFGYVVVKHDRRAFGASNYTLPMLIAHAVNMITGYSTKPLQFTSIIGFTFTLFGLSMLIFIVMRFLICGAVIPGFAFLASSIAIFSGVQLFCLGVIGEYLARIHLRTMERPAYAIHEIIGSTTLREGQ